MQYANSGIVKRTDALLRSVSSKIELENIKAWVGIKGRKEAMIADVLENGSNRLPKSKPFLQWQNSEGKWIRSKQSNILARPVWSIVRNNWSQSQAISKDLGKKLIELFEGK